MTCRDCNGDLKSVVLDSGTLVAVVTGCVASWIDVRAISVFFLMNVVARGFATVAEAGDSELHCFIFLCFDCGEIRDSGTRS